MLNKLKPKSEFTRNAITCNSGSDTLLLAMMALDIKPDDEIITTPFTFIATAETIAFLGAKPVFVDIDEKTYNIDPSKIEEKITDKTKAIMPVSLYGQPADMDAIQKIIDKTLKTNNQKLATKIQSLRVHGQSKKYTKALGSDALASQKEPSTFILLPSTSKDTTSAWAQYSIRVQPTTKNQKPETRNQLQSKLKENGIPTAVHYPKPLHLQECFEYLGYNEGDFPIAERVSKEIMSLPMNPYLKNEEINYIIERYGSGIARIKNECKKLGIIEPIFEEFSHGFRVTLFKEKRETTQKTTQKTTKEKILDYLKNNAKMTRDELASKTGVSANAIKQHLANLQKEKKLQRKGGRKDGYWEVLDDK